MKIYSVYGSSLHEGERLGEIRVVLASDYDALAADLAETQRQLKNVAPIGEYNGRDIEGWAKYGAQLEAALIEVLPFVDEQARTGVYAPTIARIAALVTPQETAVSTLCAIRPWCAPISMRWSSTGSLSRNAPRTGDLSMTDADLLNQIQECLEPHTHRWTNDSGVQVKDTHAGAFWMLMAEVYNRTALSDEGKHDD